MGLTPDIIFNENGENVGLGTDHPLPVTGSMALGASELHLGKIGGETAFITVTPVVALSGYIAGDVVGGKLTIASAVRTVGGTGILQSIHLLDKSNTKPALNIILFESDPAAATLTDNAAFVSGSDDVKIIAVIPIAASDWITPAGKALCTKNALGIVLKTNGGVNVYMAITVVTAPTFVSTSDLVLRFGILQD